MTNTIPDEKRTFWLVWVKGRPAPAFQHFDYEEACREAERLANKEPNMPVYILEAIQWVKAGERPLTWGNCE